MRLDHDPAKAVIPMPSAENRPILLAAASPKDFLREFTRRGRGRLAALPDGKRWTTMDFVFATIVALLALSSTGFFTTTYRIFAADPDYFTRRLIAEAGIGRLDPIETGTVITSGEEGVIPVPRMLRQKPLEPSDYEIVMVFGDEALLATSHELLRVKAGSTLPGLGTILAVDAASNAVRSQNATLRMATP